MRMRKMQTNGWLEATRRWAVMLLAFAVLLAFGPAAIAAVLESSGATSPSGCCDQPAPAQCTKVTAACAVVCAGSSPSPLDHPQVGAFVPVMADCRIALIIAPWNAPQRRLNPYATRVGPPSYLRFGRLLL